MRKTLAIALCISLAVLLCACGGIRNNALGNETVPAGTRADTAPPGQAIQTAAPAPTTGTEAADVDGLLKELDSLTAGDDYEAITVDEAGADAIENEAQDIVTDLEKNFDMPVN